MRGQDYYYSKIIDDLNLKIGLGEYSVGMFLPSEKRLAGQYDVSISTVRKALSGLEQRGFVKKLNGKGTIVIEPDDTKLHQLAFNSGYVEKALRYLHGCRKVYPGALPELPGEAHHRNCCGRGSGSFDLDRGGTPQGADGAGLSAS